MLEVKNSAVTLYLLRDHPTVDYFQVASEIARFVFVKSSETYFDAICSRLELSLEKLRERGIPVGRLVKHVERIKGQL